LSTLVLLTALAGCRQRSDLVEAELRTRERELRETRGELASTHALNEALENTLRDQRACRVPGGHSASSPLVKDIQLGRGTGGLDEDRIPGDEALQIVLVPRDVDGSPIKAPGSLRVTALEISSEGLKTPLSTWEVSADKLRPTWRNGLFASGYFVVLPWKTVPQSERLRVVAQFTPLDGPTFEAEKDVSIKLLAEPHRHDLIPPSAPPPAGLTPPTPLTPPTSLPPPTPVETTPIVPPPVPVGPPLTSTSIDRWRPVPATPALATLHYPPFPATTADRPSSLH
jgi:hypothetical protein